ncbi:MAG: prephenate dehydratase [Chitinophagaceae bacterium]
MRVAIQGFEGCFHQVAAENYFGKGIEIIPCATFAELIRKVGRQDADAGVMAIENSIVGSILPNYNLLQKSRMQVTGEIYLSIRQHLMMLPGQHLEDIREVHSHPMALLQCMDFLGEHPDWRLVETEDTALSAKNVRQKRLKHTAAIAGKRAAEIFELDILAHNIQTEKKNYTRFLAIRLEEKMAFPQDVNKSSVYFHTANEKGALVRVLQKIAIEGVNLSKLQSFPIPGSEWKYYFHADLEFEDLNQFEKVIQEIQPLTEGLKILGIYRKGITI